MPLGLPHRPPLAMRLWLAQRFGRADRTGSSSAATGRSSGKAMSIESLEHMVRNRVRMFLRHTWLVTFLGSIALGDAAWAAFYFTTQPTVMRIAAGSDGSDNAKLAQVFSQKFADDRDKIRFQFVATAGPKESAQALANRDADLAILPSTIGNSPDWPVVAILRQNVMALIVPAPATPITAKKETSAPAKKETSAAEKKEAGAKGSKSARAGKGDKAAAGKNAKATKSGDAEAAEAGGDKSGEDAGETAAADDKSKKVRQ